MSRRDGELRGIDRESHRPAVYSPLEAYHVSSAIPSRSILHLLARRSPRPLPRPHGLILKRVLACLLLLRGSPDQRAALDTRFHPIPLRQLLPVPPVLRLLRAHRLEEITRGIDDQQVRVRALRHAQRSPGFQHRYHRRAGLLRRLPFVTMDVDAHPRAQWRVIPTPVGVSEDGCWGG